MKLNRKELYIKDELFNNDWHCKAAIQAVELGRNIRNETRTKQIDACKHFGKYKLDTFECQHCCVAVECYEGNKSIKWCGCGDELRSDEDIKTKTCWICRSIGR